MAFSFAIILSGCSSGEKAVVGETVDDLKNSTGNAATRGSRKECISGCVMLWKANKDNDAKPEEEMNKYCNQLCDAGEGMKNSDPESCAKGEGSLLFERCERYGQSCSV
ncbi:MAG: hypothetical protein WC823_07010 [Parcubacteria group bacterium]|jgi:hypothetical protein